MAKRDDRVFFPVRRGTGVLIYELVPRVETGRTDFVVRASSDGPDDALRPVVGSGAVRDRLDQFAGLLTCLPAIEAALGRISLADVSSYDAAFDLAPECCVIDGIPLMTAAVYQQFFRTMLVHEAAIRRYEGQPAEVRVDVGVTANVYSALLQHADIETAERLLEADLPVIRARTPRQREWAYLLNQVARVLERLDRRDEAIGFVEAGCRIHKTVHALRFLGNLRASQGDLAGAVSAFVDCDALEPLRGDAAMKLSRWYERLGEADRARHFADRAKAVSDG